MNLFSKKAKARAVAKAKVENDVKTIAGIRQEIGAIENIFDAGERYLAFMALEEKIQKHIADEAASRHATQIKKQKSKRLFSGLTFSLSGAVTIGAGAALVAAHAIAVPLMVIPGCLLYSHGIREMGAPLDKNSASPSRESTDGLLETLESLSGIINRKKEALIQNDMPDIAISRHAQELCDKVPDIQAAFAKAALEEGVLRAPVRLDKPSPPQQKP